MVKHRVGGRLDFQAYVACRSNDLQTRASRYLPYSTSLETNCGFERLSGRSDFCLFRILLSPRVEPAGQVLSLKSLHTVGGGLDGLFQRVPRRATTLGLRGR